MRPLCPRTHGEWQDNVAHAQLVCHIMKQVTLEELSSLLKHLLVTCSSPSFWRHINTKFKHWVCTDIFHVVEQSVKIYLVCVNHIPYFKRLIESPYSWVMVPILVFLYNDECSNTIKIIFGTHICPVWFLYVVSIGIIFYSMCISRGRWHEDLLLKTLPQVLKLESLGACIPFKLHRRKSLKVLKLVVSNECLIKQTNLC